MQKNIVLVDKHPLVFQGIRRLCREYGYHVIDAYSEGNDIYKTIIEARPEFIILDIHRIDMKSAEIAKVLSTMNLISRTIVFSEYDNLFYQRECIYLGIRAYISKTLEIDNVIQAMHALNAGSIYYPTLKTRSSTQGIKNFDRYILDNLTDREQLVLKKLSAGMSNKEISIDLNLSNKTISTYKQRLLEKLGARSLIEAVDIARMHEIP
ncbi:response regulator transcription factor [Pantoea sp. SOD02]|uniref:response regulator transcription factor n=1 Tax=Pantoea sp. SOD02 TaxID=2970818 RepID=UPI002157998A|nr:response regulator transcription factor [Pantoea sp. SOD02]UVC31714.1 response regulator transcription factor [Pantoea sp. SOD02]